VSLCCFVLFSSQALAQGQGEVNPFFNAGSKNQFYINFNYDCTSLPWPDDAIKTHRKIFYDSDGVPVDVNTYYVFKGETIIDIEKGIRNQVQGGSENEIRDINNFGNGFNSKYLIHKPVYISDEIVNDPIYESLKPLKSQVVCFTGILQPKDLEDSVTGDKVTVFLSPRVQDTVIANFVPPTLQQIENYAIDAIYMVWAFIGIFATVRLLYLGFQFMTNSFSPEKKGELASQLALWAVGLVGFFLAIPFLQFVYDLLDIRTTKCFYHKDATNDTIYYNLTMPGFTFFFKDVCTGPHAIDDSAP
jgi:hypothetical protein